MIYHTITFSIALLLLLCYCLLLRSYLKIFTDSITIIETKKDFWKKILLIFVFVLCFSIIIGFRIARMGRKFDLKVILDNFIHYLLFQKFDFAFYWSLTLIIIFVIAVAFTWFFVIKTIILLLKRAISSIFIYTMQYEIHHKFTQLFMRYTFLFKALFFILMQKYTKNQALLSFSIRNWPLMFFLFEKVVFKFLLPYAIVFDLILYKGSISLIFVIAPWYFIYTLFRSFFIYYYEITYREDYREIGNAIYDRKRKKIQLFKNLINVIKIVIFGENNNFK